MTPQDFAYIIQWNDRVNARNLEGISHADSLVQPPDGNCINWIVGHIIVSRDSILRHCGAEPVAPAAVVERYARGSAPVSDDGLGAIPLDELRSLLRRSTEALLAAFDEVGDTTLDGGDDPERTPRSRIQFLLLHDTYHAGQLALARRIAGKPGAIP